MESLEKVKEKIKIIHPVVDKLSIETLEELKGLIDNALAESLPEKREFSAPAIEKLLYKFDKDFMVVFAVKGMNFGLFCKGKDQTDTANGTQFLNIFARVIQSLEVKPKAEIHQPKILKIS